MSDDGGSTAEIVRVLGGPAVGDIRSRCLRLADDSNTEVHNQVETCTLNIFQQQQERNEAAHLEAHGDTAIATATCVNLCDFTVKIHV